MATVELRTTKSSCWIRRCGFCFEPVPDLRRCSCRYGWVEDGDHWAVYTMVPWAKPWEGTSTAWSRTDWKGPREPSHLRPWDPLAKAALACL